MTTTDSPSKASKYQNLITQLKQNRFVRPIGFSAFAVFLVVGATFRNPAWFITGKRIDPWFYWGTGEIMEYTAEHFSLTYYFRRWTLTFPNFIFQNLLPPVEAQLALRSLILFAILVLAGTFVYSLSKSFVTSLFVMGLISSSSFLMAGIGQSYHEGTGLVFFLGLLLVLTRLRENQAKIKSKAFLVGVMFGLFFVTYQFAMFIFFPLAIAVLWSAGRAAWRHSKDYFLPFTLGFLLIDILDFSIGLFFRYWPELLSYTFFTGSSIRSSGEFAPDLTRYLVDFLPSSANFPLPLILMGMLLLLVQTKSMQRWFPLGLIGIALMYLVLPFFGLIGPQVLHTAVYGVMATLLGAGIAISGIVDKASERLLGSVWRRDALKAAVLTPLVVLSIFATDGSWLIFVSIGTGFLALAVVLSRFELKRESKAFSNLSAMISAIILSITVLSQGLPYPASPRSDLDKVAQENSVRMTVLSKEVRALSGYATANDYRIFILDNRPHEGWSETISAFYGMYSSISEGYPAPPVDCNRLAYSVSRENPRFILMHQGDPSVSREFMEKYLAPCFLYIPVLEGEVPGVDASVFRLEAKLGP
jgi:hypothetical protein